MYILLYGKSTINSQMKRETTLYIFSGELINLQSPWIHILTKYIRHRRTHRVRLRVLTTFTDELYGLSLNVHIYTAHLPEYDLSVRRARLLVRTHAYTLHSIRAIAANYGLGMTMQ